MTRLRIALAALALLGPAQPAAALFHLAVIDELMTSYDGDLDVQFVEIKMNTAAQNLVANSVLGAFDANGDFQGDVLVVPGNVTNSGNGTRWIMGTAAFEAVAGIQVDFEIPAGLIAESGRVCWGAPDGLGIPPSDPDSWDHSDPENYVDCVAYGDYTGPPESAFGDPTPLSPDGHSLQRVSETHDNATDFACGDPATPTNNAGAAAELAATILCPEPSQLVLLACGAAALLPASRRRASRARSPAQALAKRRR